MDDDNKYIFNTLLKDSLKWEKGCFYDEELRNIRVRLIREYAGDKTVLDIGCGSGEYTLITGSVAKKVVGVDFSEVMLSQIKRKIEMNNLENIGLMQADINEKIGVKDGRFDFIYSFSTLYYIKNIETALNEMSRILRPGGHAVFSLGNYWSLNTLVCRRTSQLAVYHISYPRMLKNIRNAGLKIIKHRVFQLSPMYGGPVYLTPFVSKKWKKIMGIKIYGKMLDEIISGMFPFRYIAFRHLFICQKNGRNDG